MKYLYVIGLFFSSFCLASTDSTKKQLSIKKDMYQKQQLFDNQTSLAQLRKMQIYRLKHGI